MSFKDESYTNFFYTLLIIFTITVIILLKACIFPYEVEAFEIVDISECRAWFPTHEIVENQWHEACELIPLSEGKPDQIILGNNIHVIVYLKEILCTPTNGTGTG